MDPNMFDQMRTGNDIILFNKSRVLCYVIMDVI